MADFTYDAPADEPAPTGTRIATLTNWAGAAVSLALIAGVGVWGYKLVMRDVTGIPVVQAMEGPMRIAPEDPGGTMADHQGLAVNDVAGTGLAAPVPDQLLLAPQPAGLSEEDLPLAALPKPTPRAAVPAAPGTAQDDPESPAVAGTEAATDSADMIRALADQIAADAAPLSALAPGESPDVQTTLVDPAAEEEAQASEEVAALTGPPGALVRSLRPSSRPAALDTSGPSPEAAVAAAIAAQQGPSEIDPSTLPAGTRLAQLGAYDSPETARSEWQRFSSRFGEFMDGKSRVIERATSGGRIFYRLRAHGFADLSDARRFCAAFVAENADCIPVTTR
ncbi:SPOR domain-containing protein [Salipiger bermudensis]|uniref:SPOR domain-containing protein n=1 Tax=Salipiger bermudensis TaxID=344736 RepID=UPI001C99AA8C|nr:SPOR domain-containing protein [Salipiger bermudensis]MBY6005777.1 SPOR domain-containing protein [Salipiger bermudensis]